MNIEQANKIPIVEFLDKQGIGPAKDRGKVVWYISPLRTPEKTPSFKVDTELNKWYDHGIGKGGGLFDLALLVFKTSNAKETLGRLKDGGYESNSPASRIWQVTAQEPINFSGKIKVTGVNDLIERPRLITYLEVNRGIPFDVANAYCKAVDYSNHDKNYYAVGFPNRSGGYELRSPYFKGASSPKDITHIKRDGSKVVSIFEGFIDFLSGLTAADRLPLKGDYLILNSTSLLEKNLAVIAPYELVVCFLDNDASGKHALEILKSTGVNCLDGSIFYKGYKDVNMWLIGNKKELRTKERRLKF
jgi:hypothetical protein